MGFFCSSKSILPCDRDGNLLAFAGIHFFMDPRVNLEIHLNLGRKIYNCKLLTPCALTMIMSENIVSQFG